MFSSRTLIQSLQESARGVPHVQIDVKQSWTLRGLVVRQGILAAESNTAQDRKKSR